MNEKKMELFWMENTVLLIALADYIAFLWIALIETFLTTCMWIKISLATVQDILYNFEALCALCDQQDFATSTLDGLLPHP